ncbi:MAG: hypothetical protein AAFR15_01095 [Cyanobacteria bacterium J06627_15]
MPEPSAGISLQQLGTVDAPRPSRRAMQVYYLTYVSRGHRIGAKLFVPLGPAPSEGWPVTVWCHGLGDPASDFRRWPCTGDDWINTRGCVTGRWAHRGYATLVPWLPGAGPSEPLMSFSPFSVARNGRAVADGLWALWQLAESSHPGGESLPSLDFQRKVIRTDCVSSPLMVHLASQLQTLPGLETVRALVADDFQPSLAYNASYLNPYFLRLKGRLAAAMYCIWARTIWGLVKTAGWPPEIFFTPAAIELFGQPAETVLGKCDLIFASRLVPPTQSELAPLLYSAVRTHLEREPTGVDIFAWMFTAAMTQWATLGDLAAMLRSPFYQTYFAASDPFFADNIQPFNPGVPLLVVPRTGSRAVNTGGLPSFDERFEHMTRPKINTLKSWGWQVELIRTAPMGGTSFSGGPNQQAVMDRLGEIWNLSV